MTDLQRATIEQFQAIWACANFYGDIASKEFCERRIADTQRGCAGYGDIFDALARDYARRA